MSDKSSKIVQNCAANPQPEYVLGFYDQDMQIFYSLTPSQIPLLPLHLKEAMLRLVAQAQPTAKHAP